MTSVAEGIEKKAFSKVFPCIEKHFFNVFLPLKEDTKFQKYFQASCQLAMASKSSSSSELGSILRLLQW